MNRLRSNRRTFLKQAGRLGLAGLALPTIVPRRVLGRDGRPGANDRVQIGVIGTGVRGKYLIGNVPPEGRVVAVCDSYLPRVADTIEPKPRFAAVLQRFHEEDAAACATHQDFRRLIDEEKLDAVMIATPDHNHILPAILACQAGRDLYLEKPLSLYVKEGRSLVEAVHRHGRVCQVGSQNRSMAMNQLGSQLVREGRLGKVSLVQLPNYAGPMQYEGLPEEPVPDGLNWDMFCGQTPLRPHNRKLWVKDEFQVDGVLWRGWDLWRNYSGHLMTNWGAHSVDIVQLALGTENTGPVEFRPLRDGHLGDMRFCPVEATYADGTVLRFDLRYSDKWTFHGEHGKLLMRRNEFSTDPPDLATERPDPALVSLWVGLGIVARPHIQNWLDCIKTRARPNAPVDVGHRSVTICHLANICRELGRPLRWDPDREVCPDDEQAKALLERPRRAGYELPKPA
jgi:predicted dehydrogenase